MLWADAAQQVGENLFVLGGGWSTAPTPTPPMAVVVKIEVPWDRSNESHEWRLLFVVGDGRAVRGFEDQKVPLAGGGEGGGTPGVPQGGRAPAPPGARLIPLP